MDKRKILIVGTNDYYIYQGALCDAFIEIGHYCEIFALNKYFKSNSMIMRFIKKFEYHFVVGYDIKRLNSELISYIQLNKFDLVFLYGCNMIFPNTIKKIKERGTSVFSYHNDDFFSNYYKWYYYRYAKRILPYTDLNFVYRRKNITDIEKYCGRTDSIILQSYYIDKDNYKCSRDELIKGTPDVICMAHYEKDSRIEYLIQLIENNISVGVNLSLFEHLPEECKNKVICLKNTGAPFYNRLINSCKIPVIFLSKLNHDTYTRRCFEIPAAGAFIFCEYTEDMDRMFSEDKEAVYFRDKNDFYEKIKYYLLNDVERKRIADAGHLRLVKDGHEVKDRAQFILDIYNDFLIKKYCVYVESSHEELFGRCSSEDKYLD